MRLGGLSIHQAIPLLVGAAWLAGCGPATLLQNPADLPVEACGRRLWHTPRAYIFAADETVAGETDRWIHDLSGHLQRTYTQPLGKGLVIVTDLNDPQPVVPSLDALMRLERSSPVYNPEEEVTIDERRKKLESAGMSE